MTRPPSSADNARGAAPATEQPPASPEPARLAHDPDSICWCCAGETVKRHCKIVCTNCGFMRDCSDP